jgi:hypothetical protein
MTASARTPVPPEARPVGALSAQSGPANRKSRLNFDPSGCVDAGIPPKLRGLSATSPAGSNSARPPEPRRRDGSRCRRSKKGERRGQRRMARKGELKRFTPSPMVTPIMTSSHAERERRAGLLDTGERGREGEPPPLRGPTSLAGLCFQKSEKYAISRG